ncbi:hypothetical protein BJX66DRAFT_92549 [Aspergillus keveii]|uniref:Clr5 domain-containing protein n=1 Tax=Aspergillus keveii TaxID=714993 RepID=A0ABR4GEL6_9EURO
MGIMKIMRERYDFDAKPNQYDRKFKEWGFRKNLKSKEWRIVKSRVEKSKRAGKQCDIFVGGMLVPKDKLEKEIRRNDFPSIQERFGQGEYMSCTIKSFSTARLTLRQLQVLPRQTVSTFAHPQR